MGCHVARCRGRAGLAWGLGLFLAAQAAFALALLGPGSRLRDPEVALKLRALRRLLSAQPGRPLVLALGSSRLGVNLRPHELPGAADPGAPLVFNFALCRSGPALELLCLRRLLAAGVRPDRLLVEVSTA